MKVIDVEQVYLGYAVHWPTGISATDQHTEIEMGAEEREKGEVRCGETKEWEVDGERVRAGVWVDEEEVWRGQEGELGRGEGR